jgi:hypothetical protein
MAGISMRDFSSNSVSSSVHAVRPINYLLRPEDGIRLPVALGRPGVCFLAVDSGI